MCHLMPICGTYLMLETSLPAPACVQFSKHYMFHTTPCPHYGGHSKMVPSLQQQQMPPPITHQPQQLHPPTHPGHVGQNFSSTTFMEAQAFPCQIWPCAAICTQRRVCYCRRENFPKLNSKAVEELSVETSRVLRCSCPPNPTSPGRR